MSNGRPGRIGLYGGTFDPVHIGHALMAYDALEQAQLDQLWFIPCRQSPHKDKPTVASGEQRSEMIRLATQHEPRFAVSTIELDRASPSYSIDTVEAVRQMHPQAELFWVIGQDQLPGLGSWHRAQELFRMVTFLMFARSQADSSSISLYPEARIFPVNARRIDISATEIRNRLRSGLPVRHFVSLLVAEYIDEHRLYRGV